MAKQKRFYVAKIPRSPFHGVRYVVRERGTDWESYVSWPRKADAQALANENNRTGSKSAFNPAMPRDKWVNAKIMITRSGQIKAKIGGR